MYPSNQDAHHDTYSKGQPVFQPPVTGVPVGPGNQYYNESPQYPLNHHQHGNEGTWSTGLCDCTSDCSTCCVAWWCPCITFGQIAEIVDKGTTSCGTSGALYCLLTWFTGCGCLCSALYRSKLRNQYNLEKSPCNDCLVHFCCESCALSQEYRELKNREFNVSIGWEGNMERQNQGIAMSPPSAPAIPRGMSRQLA